MKKNAMLISTLNVLFILLFLTACSSEPEEQTTVSSSSADCPAEAEFTYVCGVLNAEDLLLLGDTGMVLASGMTSENVKGELYLIDSDTDSVVRLISSTSFTQAWDRQAYPDCPGPLNLESFSAHGLSLNEYSDNLFTLYITSHGEREAIEMFNIDVSSGEAIVTWTGCVELLAGSFFNSVAILADGGFVTTQMMAPNMDFSALAGGGISGSVFEWHPGGEVFSIEGTELSGANGIALSEDERYMYVAAFGSNEIVKFDRSTSPLRKESVAIDIVPDNIRWGDAGKLLTAGSNYVSPDECAGEDCGSGWSIVEIDADTLSLRRVGGADQNVTMQGISSALIVGDDFWVGTFNGDRVAHFAR